MFRVQGRAASQLIVRGVCTPCRIAASGVPPYRSQNTHEATAGKLWGTSAVVAYSCWSRRHHRGGLWLSVRCAAAHVHR